MIPPGKKHSVRLCATFVRTVNIPGRYGDGYGGHGLSLLVTPRKSWRPLQDLGAGYLSQRHENQPRPRFLPPWSPSPWPASARSPTRAPSPKAATPDASMQHVPTFAKANEDRARDPRQAL